MKLLSASLGGTKALTKNAPICAGRYNESKGMEVSNHQRLLVNVLIEFNKLNCLADT